MPRITIQRLPTLLLHPHMPWLTIQTILSMTPLAPSQLTPPRAASKVRKQVSITTSIMLPGPCRSLQGAGATSLVCNTAATWPVTTGPKYHLSCLVGLGWSPPAAPTPPLPHLLTRLTIAASPQAASGVHPTAAAPVCRVSHARLHSMHLA